MSKERDKALNIKNIKAQKRKDSQNLHCSMRSRILNFSDDIPSGYQKSLVYLSLKTRAIHRSHITGSKQKVPVNCI